MYKFRNGIGTDELAWFSNVNLVSLAMLELMDYRIYMHFITHFQVNAEEMTMFETLLLRGAALVLCDAVGVPRPAVEEAAPQGAEASTLRTADREELSALLGRPISEAGIDAAMDEVARGTVGLSEATRFFARHAHRRAEGRRDLLGPLLSRFPQTMPSAAEVSP